MAKKGSLLREIPIIVVAAVVVSVIVKTFLVHFFFIPSGSMQNTLQIGDRIAVNKVATFFSEIKRGEVVVFKDPNNWLGSAPVTENKTIVGKVKTGLEWAESNTYGYYKVVTKTNPDIGMTDINKFKIDANTYNDLVETDNSYVLEDGSNLRIVVTKETKSYYEYEQELNENKRLISILKPEFVSEIEGELISIMKDTVA